MIAVVVELVLGLPPALGVDDTDPPMGPVLVESRHARPVTVATGESLVQVAVSESGVHAATRRVSVACRIELSTAASGSAGTSSKTLVVELTANENIELGWSSTSTDASAVNVNNREKKNLMPCRRGD